jgi:hypothetical protein
MSFFDSTVREHQHVSEVGVAFQDAVRQLRNEVAHGRRPALPPEQSEHLAELLDTLTSLLDVAHRGPTPPARAMQVPAALIIQLDRERKGDDELPKQLARVADRLKESGRVESRDIEVLAHVARASGTVVSGPHAFSDGFF